ncbi:DUF3016 domain-containing protein [Ancylobacter dichloromethanicus]|uniref:DUF3016 domain-containing protein n=1 Tax=Ancylobacter dichloromethanicus TaxID=518825 RepID=A0A9W6N1L5_9HYPH|nr:DUF3016 domain-containing protein [Ancylobacter dichloromethanicus]MBS7553384.1 DUF3016 domain-containing protein [Ancylobacter dichloromethanicus]GLK74305.1 hypothetical protein GCM10017643_44230 [Ancylobacter dichloromethanicus]
MTTPGIPPLTRAALALGAVLLLPGAAQAATHVTFRAPETYRDGNLSWGPVEQRLTLEGLERIIQRLAAKRLPAGYEIDVTVLDLDLAGRINPLRSRTGERRVMRQDTWPSMTLRYTLRRSGKVIARGEETLRAMNYLTDPVAVRSTEPLRFETAMLDRWFRTRFAALEAKRPAS